MTVVLVVGAIAAAWLMFDSSHRRPSIARPRRLSLGLPIAVLSAGVLGTSGSFVLLLLVPCSGIAATGFVRHEKARRRRLRELVQLPIVVEILARQLAVGEPVALAIAGLDRAQREASGLEEPLARIRSGTSVTDALASTPGLLGAALYAAETVGAPGGNAVERLADRMRSAALDGRSAQSQSGQQLASAAVMTLIPPIVSLLYALSDERAANFYLRTPWGAVVVTVSLSLSATGWFWMRYITRPRGIT